MVKIRDRLSKSTKIFVSVLIIMSVIGSIIFADVFSGNNNIKLTGLLNQNMLTVYAEKDADGKEDAEDQPDSAIDISLAALTSRAAEYFNACNNGLTSCHGNWDADPTGLYGAFDENDTNSKNNNWFGIIRNITKSSNVATVYSYEKDKINASYVNTGRTLHAYGLDQYKTGINSIARFLSGALMYCVAVIASVIGTIFTLMKKVVTYCNPFGFFAEVSRFGGQISSTGNKTPRLVTYFSGVYDSFAEFAVNVVIPLTCTIFVVGFFVSRAYRSSAAHHFKKLAIRVIFVVVGIPLIGSIYNTAINGLFQDFALDSAFVDNVVLSTFVDFEGVVTSNGAVPKGTKLFIGKTVTNRKDNSKAWSELRNYALNMNKNAGHEVSEGSTFTNKNGLFATNSENSFNAVTGSGSKGGANDDSLEVILSYMMADTYSSADYSADYYDANTKNAYMAFQYAFYPGTKGIKEYMVKLPASLSESEDKVNVVGIAYKDGTWNGSPFVADATGDNFSVAGSYNYLSTEFKEKTMVVHMPKTPSQQSSVQHYSANLIGGNALMQIVLYVNAFVMLVGYNYLAIAFVWGSTVNAIFFGFDVMAEALFASLGFYKSIARCIAAMCCIIVEVMVALMFFSMCCELMYTLSYTTSEVVAEALSGASGLIAGTLLATVVQVMFVIFCAKWKKNIVKSFQDVCREAIEQFMGVSTAGGFGAGTAARDAVGSTIAAAPKIGAGALGAAHGVAGAMQSIKAGAQSLGNTFANNTSADKDANQVDAADDNADNNEAQRGGADKAAENNTNKEGGSAVNNHDGDNNDKSDKAIANSVGDSVTDADKDGKDSAAEAADKNDAESKSGSSSSTSETTSETSESSEDDGDKDKNAEENGENRDGNITVNGDAIVNGDAKSNDDGKEDDGDNTTTDKLNDNMQRAEREQKIAESKAKAMEHFAKAHEMGKTSREGLADLAKSGFEGDDYAGGIAASVGAAYAAGKNIMNYETDGGLTGHLNDAVNGAHMNLNDANKNLANAKNAAAEASKNGVTEKRTYRDPETGRLTTEEVDPLTGNTTETTTDEDGNKITTTTAYGEGQNAFGMRPVLATSTTKENPETGEKESTAIAYDAKAAKLGIKKPIGISSSHVGKDGERYEESRDADGNVTHMKETDKNGNTLRSFDRLADGGSHEYKAETDEDGNLISSIDTVTAADGTGSVTASSYDENGNASSVTVSGSDAGNTFAVDENGNVKTDNDGNLVTKDGKSVTKASDINTDGSVSVTNSDGTGSEILRDEDGLETLSSETHKTSDGNLETVSKGTARNAFGGITAITSSKSVSDANGNHLRTESVTSVPGENGEEDKEISRSVTDAEGNTTTTYPKQTGRYETVDENGERHLGGEATVSSSDYQSADGKTRTSTSVTSYNGGVKNGQRTEKTTSTKLNDDGTIASSTETTTNYDADGNIVSQESTTVDSKSGNETTSTLVRGQDADGNPVMSMSTSSRNMKTGERKSSSSISVPMVQAYDEQTGAALVNNDGSPKLVPAIDASGKPARQPVATAPVMTSVASDSSTVPEFDSSGNPVIGEDGKQNRVPAVNSDGKSAMVPVYNRQTGQPERDSNGNIRMQPAVSADGRLAMVPKLDDKGNPVTQTAMSSAVSNAATVPAYNEKGEPVMNADGTQARVPAVNSNGRPAMIPVFNAQTGKAERDSNGNIRMQPAVNENGDIANVPEVDSHGQPVVENSKPVMSSAVSNMATVPAYNEKGEPVMNADGTQARVPAVNSNGKPAMVPVFNAQTGKAERDNNGNIRMQPAVNENGDAANVPKMNAHGQPVVENGKPVMSSAVSNTATVPAYNEKGEPVMNADGTQARVPAVNSNGKPAMIPVFNSQTGKAERDNNGNIRMQPAVDANGKAVNVPEVDSHGQPVVGNSKPVMSSAVSNMATVPAYNEKGEPVMNADGTQARVPAVNSNGKPAMIPVFNAQTGKAERDNNGNIRMQPAVDANGKAVNVPKMNANGQPVVENGKPVMSSAVSNTATVPAYNEKGEPVMNADGTQARVPAVNSNGKPAMIPVFNAQTGKAERDNNGNIRMQPAVDASGKAVNVPEVDSHGQPVVRSSKPVMSSAVSNVATVPAYNEKGEPVMNADGTQARVPAVNSNGRPAMIPVFNAQTGKAERDSNGNIRMQPAVDANGKAVSVPKVNSYGQPVKAPVMVSVSSDSVTVPAYNEKGEPVMNADGTQARVPAVNSNGKPAMVPVFNAQTGKAERDINGNIRMQPAVNAKGEFAKQPVVNASGQVQTSPVFEDVSAASMMSTVNAVKETSGTLKGRRGTYTTTTNGTKETTVKSFNDGTVTTINKDTATGQSVIKTERPDGTVVTEETRQISVPGGGTVSQTIRTTEAKADSNGNVMQTVERVGADGKAEMTIQTVSKADGSRSVQVRMVGENGQPKSASYNISKNNEVSAMDRTALAEMGVTFNETNGAVTENIAGIGERTTSVNGGRINTQSRTVTGGSRSSSRTVSSNTSRPAGMMISSSETFSGDNGQVISNIESSYDRSGNTASMKSSSAAGHTVRFNANQAVSRTEDGRTVTSSQAVYESTDATGASTVITGGNAADVMSAVRGEKSRNVQIHTKGAGQQESHTEISGNGRAKVTGTTVTGDRFSGVTNSNGSGEVISETSSGEVVKQTFAKGGHVKKAQSVNNITGAAENIVYNEAGQITQRQTRNAANVETVYNASYSTQGNMTGGSVSVNDKFRGTQVTTGVNQHGVVTRSVKDSVRGVNTVHTVDNSGVETFRSVDATTGNTMQSVNNTRSGVKSVTYSSENCGANKFTMTQDADGNVITRRFTNHTILESRTKAGGSYAETSNIPHQFRQASVGTNGIIAPTAASANMPAGSVNISAASANIPAGSVPMNSASMARMNIPVNMTAGTVVRGSNNAVNIQGMAAAGNVANYASVNASMNGGMSMSANAGASSFRGGYMSGGNIMNASPAGSGRASVGGQTVINNYYMGSQGGLSSASNVQTVSSGSSSNSARRSGSSSRGLSATGDSFTARTMVQGMSQSSANEAVYGRTTKHSRVAESVRTAGAAVSRGVGAVQAVNTSLQSRTDGMGKLSRRANFAATPVKALGKLAAGTATGAAVAVFGKDGIVRSGHEFAQRGREARRNGTLTSNYADSMSRYSPARQSGTAKPYNNTGLNNADEYRMAQFGGTDNIMNTPVRESRGLTEEDVRRMIYEQSAVMNSNKPAPPPYDPYGIYPPPHHDNK